MMQKLSKDIFQSMGEAEGKSYVFLLKALEKNSLENFDYLKFKTSLNALKKLQMDQGTAIKSAFATGSTMGLTKEHLLKSAKHYKSILSKEREDFESALEDQINDRINTRKNEADKLKEVILQCREQIKKLELKIEECQNRIDKTDQDIKDAESRIMNSRDKFVNTYKSLIEEIDQDLSTFDELL